MSCDFTLVGRLCACQSNFHSNIFLLFVVYFFFFFPFFFPSSAFRLFNGVFAIFNNSIYCSLKSSFEKTEQRACFSAEKEVSAREPFPSAAKLLVSFRCSASFELYFCRVMWNIF